MHALVVLSLHTAAALVGALQRKRGPLANDDLFAYSKLCNVDHMGHNFCNVILCSLQKYRSRESGNQF